MEILKMNNIKKSFNGVPVLKGVHLNVRKGEIHALLGENGAGKSTLMNTLGGVIQPDSGEINLFGNEVKITNSFVSKNLGVGFVHQELNLIPDLSVYENLFLGYEIKNRFGFLNKKEMINQTEIILNSLNVTLNPEEVVSHLDASNKQIIEISKTLLHKSKLIIMDEPTTSLTDKEIQNLFRVMNNLRDNGYSIIFISHKLKEVMEICDRYTVLRDGELVECGDIKDVTEEKIASLLVGKELNGDIPYQQREFGETVLEAQKLTCIPYYRDVTFSIKKGEIIGITGLSGDGRTELVETIFGYRKKTNGEILLHDKIAKINHPKTASNLGIGFIPKNRKENSIIKDLSVLQNFTLPSIKNFTYFSFINRKKEIEKYEFYRQKLQIKASDIDSSIANLSGGNQQKVIIAKWVEANSEIIILDNPTQGVDIGAKNEIYSLLIELAKQGKTFIVLSNEYPEIHRLCDRILVMYQGQLQAELTREELTEETIMMYATGSKYKGGIQHD